MYSMSGQLLFFLMNNVQLLAEDVHVVGFSLGGQLVAFIGQEQDGNLARITGLDPAGTFFLLTILHSVIRSRNTDPELLRDRMIRAS